MRAVLLPLLLAAAGCSRAEPPAAPKASEAALPRDKDVVLFVGDSLTAGHGVSLDEAYPALLGRRWAEAGLGRRARNAGVSGATSAGVLANLDWSLAPDVALVVVAVGANDGLRGLSPADLERNLDAILAQVKAAGARAVLAEMRVPPNYGADYAARFAAVFPSAAKRAGVPLLPFFLDGVAGLKEMNQADGIHPNEAGHRRMAENVHSFLKKEGFL